MISRFLRGTKARQCPANRICSECTKKSRNPYLCIERSDQLSKPSSSYEIKDQPQKHPSQESKLCQWYRRRKTVNELNRITKEEEKRLEYLRREKARQEREAEFLELLIQRERALHQAEKQLERSPEPDYCDILSTKIPCYGPNYSACYSRGDNTQCKPKKTKKRKYKGIARPMYETYYTSTGRGCHQKDSFNERFTNFCYRICCQFYCCMTIILIIGILFTCFC